MKKIIMVDDDADILDVFKIVFERAGYDITIFDKPDALFNNQFDEPDIFIIDKQLSGADGLEVCRFLKRRQPKKDTPVIIFSATPRMSTLAQEAGADDFLEKPFKTKALLDMVQKHLHTRAA
jgi:CheY-like chemotaxis protein